MLKITYTAVDEKGKHSIKDLPWEQAIDKGFQFKENNVDYYIYESDKLYLLVHKHAKNIHKKLAHRHLKTIAQLYEFDMVLCYELIQEYGGTELINHLTNTHTEKKVLFN
jgi:hypothetical protein